MQRFGPLQVECSVIFWKHVLAIGFLAHLDKRNRIAARFHIRDLVRGILWRTIDQRNRYHGGQTARVAAGVKKIESHLIFLVVDIRRLMPRIDRRAVGRGLIRIRRMPDEVIEFSIRRSCSQINFANRITAAVPAIRRAVAVTGVGRFRHPNSQIPHRHGRGRELQSFGPTGAVHDGAAWKCKPCAFRGLLNGIFARPVLHEIMPRKGLSPSDADGIDGMSCC